MLSYKACTNTCPNISKLNQLKNYKNKYECTIDQELAYSAAQAPGTRLVFTKAAAPLMRITAGIFTGILVRMPVRMPAVIFLFPADITAVIFD